MLLSLSFFSLCLLFSTDIDDALHCRPLPNGNWELGVHIADVSHYVRPETAIDLEGANRGTSVYLVDKRIDMLPSKLSTNLCSLRSDVDRLTFSVLWEFTPEGEIVDTTFHKAVIRSVASFTYEQAQNLLDSESVSHSTHARSASSVFVLFSHFPVLCLAVFLSVAPIPSRLRARVSASSLAF